MKKRTVSFPVTILLALVSIALARPTYVGYSAAPGSNGACASSCHGSLGGSIEVSGFPSEYFPDHASTVIVAHSSGSPIKQYNGSCRIGTGSSNAGTISAGTNSPVYNTSGEANGIHLSLIDKDSAEFVWTAPPAGTGEVRL